MPLLRVLDSPTVQRRQAQGEEAWLRGHHDLLSTNERWCVPVHPPLSACEILPPISAAQASLFRTQR